MTQQHPPPFTRDVEGRPVIPDIASASPFYTEDIIFRGVPIGLMTYGFARLSHRTLKGIASIGRFCSIAESVSVTDITHPLDWVSTNPIIYRADRGLLETNVLLPKSIRQKNQPVTIGHDVWIGEGARILRPVKLSHGCVIAAGAVVTKDVPPYAIVAGCPARIIRYRIPEPLIPPMLKISWWHWSLDKIRSHIDGFYDPKAFVEKHQESGI